jgi:hypothetical protein
MKLVERPEPQGAALAGLSGANYGDVVVQVHASGFTWDELAWPSTWIDRLGRDRKIVRRARDGRVRTNIDNVATLDDAVAALNPTKRINGKTIIRVRP